MLKSSFAAGCAALLLGGVWFAADAARGAPAVLDFASNPNVAWYPARPEGDEFIPPPSGPGPVQAEKGHEYIPNRGGQPAYRIADLANPILKPWVAEKLKEANDRVRGGKVPFVPQERCWPGGVPGWEVYTRVRPLYFMQTEKEVTIVDELDHQVRHVYMNMPHSRTVKPSWYGESIGRYEGGELVIDTVGLNDKSLIDNYGTPHTDRIHVVERLKLVDGGKTVQATVTVDDPGAFNMPWTAIQRWRRTEDRPMEELACAENNYTFLDYEVMPIPEAKKPDF